MANDAVAARPPDPKRRRHRRQNTTFLSLLTGVVALGLLAFATFQGLLPVPFGSRVAASLACPTHPAGLQPATLTKVRVYNASDRRGLALATARELQRRGFTVPEPPSNDPRTATVSAAAVIRHGTDGFTAARTVATQVKGKVTYEPDDRLGEVVDLVLGQPFALVDANAGRAALRAAPAASTACST